MTGIAGAGEASPGAAPVVVFGASGFVGRHLLDRLARTGCHGVAVARRHIDAPPGVEIVTGDLAAEDGLASRLPPRATFVNLVYAADRSAADNLALANRLADVARRSQAVRFVHVSTATVAGAAPESWITEETVCRPITPYQHAKLAVERRLEEQLGPAVRRIVIRPTAVFGHGGLNLVKLTEDLRTRPWVENYVRACLFGRRPMNLVPVETVAAAILFAVQVGAAAPDALYIVAADDDPSNNFRDVERRMKAALGVRPYPVPPLSLPPAALDVALRLAGRRASNPVARFSSDRLRRAGFVPPVTFGDALAKYAREIAAEGAPHP